MSKITQRVESYELILDEVKEVFSLKDIRFLRNKNVHAISVSFQFGLNPLYSYTDKNLVTNFLAKSSWITIIDENGKTILQDYPVANFYQEKFYIPGLKTKIDLNKSFVRIKDQVPFEQGRSMVFTFFFNDRPLAWKKYFQLKSEQVIVLVDDIAKTKFFLPDIDTLRNKKLKAIQYDNNVQQVTIDGNIKILSDAEYSSYLVLQFKNSPVIKRIPLYVLDYDTNREENKILFDDLEIDLVNSYVEIAHTAFNVLNSAYAFNWYYTD